MYLCFGKDFIMNSLFKILKFVFITSKDTIGFVLMQIQNWLYEEMWKATC